MGIRTKDIGCSDSLESYQQTKERKTEAESLKSKDDHIFLNQTRYSFIYIQAFFPNAILIITVRGKAHPSIHLITANKQKANSSK